MKRTRDHDALFAAAMPACRTCGEPVQTLEWRWQRVYGDGADWVSLPTFICGSGHSHLVEEDPL